jgi:hypothetical protein
MSVIFNGGKYELFGAGKYYGFRVPMPFQIGLKSLSFYSDNVSQLLSGCLKRDISDIRVPHSCKTTKCYLPNSLCPISRPSQSSLYDTAQILPEDTSLLAKPRPETKLLSNIHNTLSPQPRLSNCTLQNSTLLLRGNISSNLAPTTPVTFAIWMPFPWKVDNEEAPETSKIGASHGLFQLEPTLQVLRPICPWSPAANMIDLNTEAGMLRFGKGAENRLTINFNNSIAVLHYIPKPSTTEHANVEIDEYRDLGEPNKEWKTTMHVQVLGSMSRKERRRRRKKRPGRSM